MYADLGTVRTLCQNVQTQIPDDLITVASAWVNVQIDAMLAQVFYWPTGSDGIAVPVPAAVTQIASFLTAALVESLAYSSVVGPEGDGLVKGSSTWGKYLKSMAEGLLNQIICHTALVPYLQPQTPILGQNVNTTFRLETGLAYVSQNCGIWNSYGNSICGRP